jgi:hypothetical protein
VGNGHAIKFLANPWIPGLKPGSFSTLTPIPDGATVACLQADDHGAWDTDVVRSIFEEEIATRILQIPVSRWGGDISYLGLTQNLVTIRLLLFIT